MVKTIITIINDEAYFASVKDVLFHLNIAPEKIIAYNFLQEFLSDPPKNVSLLLVNFSLTDKEAIENFEKLSSEFPYVPVIFLADEADDAIAEKSIELGANEVVLKNDLSTKTLRKAIDCAIIRAQTQTCINNSNIFFEDSPNPMWIYDTDSLKFLAVNKSVIHLYGYSKKEFLKMTIQDIRPEEDNLPLNIILNEHKIILEKQQPKINFDVGTWRHRKKNGELFYVSIYAHYTTYNGRKANFIMAIDVTNKVLIEQQNTELAYNLKEQKERYADILESISEVVWSCRADNHQVLFINDVSQFVYGYLPKELISGDIKLSDIVHPADKAVYKQGLESLKTTGKSCFEYRILHKDGSIKYIVNKATYRKGAGNDSDIITGLAVDVTKLHQTEQALKEKFKEVETVLESITEAFFAVDADWNYTYINKEAEKFFERKRETMLHQSMWKNYKDADRSEYYIKLNRAMKEQIVTHFEEYLPDRNLWLQARVFPTGDGLAIYFSDITEEKTLKDKIRNDEKNFIALINNTDDYIWSVDRNLKVISINQAYKDFFIVNGGSAPDTGSDIISFYSGEYIQEIWENNYAKALTGAHFKVISKEVVNHNLLYREISLNPIIDNNKEVIGVCCFSRDISEERKLQEKILKDEQNLRAIINNTKDIIWSVDTEHNIISANQAFHNRIALITGKSHLNDVNVKDFEEQRLVRWTNYINRALQDESYKIVEEDRYLDKTVFEEISFNPIHDSEYKVIGVSCFSRDITEERMLQQKIIKEGQNLKALINNTPDLIWSIDRDLNIILANQAYIDFISKVLGETCEPGMNSLWKNTNKEIDEKRRRNYNKALQGIQYNIIEEEMYNGVPIYMEISFNPIFDAAGKVVGVSCISRDISEQRKHQLKVEEQNKKLMEIAWIQSHKVRGPVARILGLANLFNYEDSADPLNKEILEGLKIVTQELDVIIKEVVDKSNITD